MKTHLKFAKVVFLIFAFLAYIGVTENNGARDSWCKSR